MRMGGGEPGRRYEHRGRLWSVRAWAPPIVFAAAFAGGFVAGTPYALIDAATFKTAFVNDSTQLSRGHNIILGRGWSYHFTNTLPYGLGLPIFVASLAGWIPFVRHCRKPAIVIGAFAAAFYLAIAARSTVFFRYLLPLVPIACLTAPILVTHLGSWLAARTHRSAAMVMAVPAALVPGPGPADSARVST